VNVLEASDPKRQVIAHLKRSGPSSTRAVAASLGVTDVAARQHLFGLERQGLVQQSTSRPSGRGRPSVLWSLTPLANDLFPDRHDALTLDLIDGIRTALGEDALLRVIDARTRRQAASLRKVVRTQAKLRDRVEALAEQRTAEGYMAEVEDAGDGALLLIEHHCPICDAAQACQRFCITELELFRDVLGPDADVVREEHLLSGGERCRYRISPKA